VRELQPNSRKIKRGEGKRHQSAMAKVDRKSPIKAVSGLPGDIRRRFSVSGAPDRLQNYFTVL